MCAQRRFRSYCANRIFPGHILDAKFLQVINGDSDQTARVRRLVCVFFGRTCRKYVFWRCDSIVETRMWEKIYVAPLENTTSWHKVHHVTFLNFWSFSQLSGFNHFFYYMKFSWLLNKWSAFFLQLYLTCLKPHKWFRSCFVLIGLPEWKMGWA